MTRPVHTCPVCSQQVRQREAQVRSGGRRWHQACWPRGPGRPPLGPDGRGDGHRTVVGVSLSPAELDRLDTLRGGTSRAEYLRQRAGL